MSDAADATGTVESFPSLQDEKTVTWGEAQFTINKLLPTEAKAVFVHHVRPLLRGALSAEAPAGGGKTEMWRLMLSAFTDAPANHYDAISAAMAKTIQVRRGAETRFLAGNEGWAFQDLEGAHAMALDGRAFLVNFREWLPVVLSEFPRLMQDFGLPSLETLTRSSETS